MTGYFRQDITGKEVINYVEQGWRSDVYGEPAPGAAGRAACQSVGTRPVRGSLERIEGHAGLARQQEAVLAQLDAVFRFAVYLTGNELEAEDLVQDTSCQALRKHHLFRPGTDLKAWLFRIARNLYIDQLRRKKLAPQLTDFVENPVPDDNPSEPLSTRVQPSMSLADEESFYELFGDEVRRFLSELPQPFRMALLLCDVEGLSYEEIGSVLSCPVGTVRSRISRAQGFLRSKLYEYARELGYIREQQN